MTTQSTVTTDPKEYGKAIRNAAKEMEKPSSAAGKNTSAIVTGPNDGKQHTIVCGRVITKKDLIEMHRRKLKESSELYNLGDFLRR